MSEREISLREIDKRLRRVEVMAAVTTAVMTTMVLPIGGFLAYAIWEHLLMG